MDSPAIHIKANANPKSKHRGGASPLLPSVLAIPAMTTVTNPAQTTTGSIVVLVGPLLAFQAGNPLFESPPPDTGLHFGS